MISYRLFISLRFVDSQWHSRGRIAVPIPPAMLLDYLEIMAVPSHKEILGPPIHFVVNWKIKHGLRSHLLMVL